MKVWAFAAFLLLLLLLCRTSPSVSAQKTSKLVPLIPRPMLYDEQLSNSLRIDVSLENSSPTSLVVALLFHPPGDCVGVDSYNYSITLWTPGARYPDHVGPYHAVTCSKRMSIPVTGLRRDSLYTASLIAYNNVESLKTERVTFYTTDVQRVLVEKGDHYMKITCWFARGSVAKGCHVHIDVINSYTRMSIDRKTYNITQDHSRLVGSMCVDLEPAATANRVKVYDWKEGGQVGMTPLSPDFVKGTDSECPLMGDRENFEMTRRLVVLSMAAGAMVIGVAIIIVGILCKLGKLHSHFLKPDSYAAITQDDVSKATT